MLFLKDVIKSSHLSSDHDLGYDANGKKGNQKAINNYPLVANNSLEIPTKKGDQN